MNKKKTTKKNLGEDMLRRLIKLYESQEHIKTTYRIIKKNKED